MKAICCLLAIVICIQVHGQDFCKNVKKEVSPDKKLFEYTSPPDSGEVTIIKVARTINTDPDYESDNFFMVIQLLGNLETVYTKTSDGEQVEKDESKMVIEFDDKSRIEDDTIKVSHDFTNDKSEAIRNVFYTLNDDLIKQLSTRKITKFSLAGYEKTITPAYGNAIMHYVDCMKKAGK